MEADQIIDHEESTEIDSVYNTNSENISTKKTITFYFVKYHRFEDPEITRKLEMADLEVEMKEEDIELYEKELQWYREEEKKTKLTLENCDYCCEYWTRWIYQVREELFHFQNALDEKSTVSRVAMQSPEVKELTKHIKGLKHRVQRSRLTVREEKQLIKQMRELNGEKDELVALVSSNHKEKQEDVVEGCEDFMYKYKKTPREKLQLLFECLDAQKAKQRSIRKNTRYLKDYLEELDNNITCLVQKMDKATSELEAANDLRHELKELIDKQNAYYNENHRLINSARSLAAKKDMAALAELSNSEVEKFFSQWSSNETFRNDYNRRVIWSLDSRGLSKDGRTRNPDESPIVQESSIPWPSPVVKKNLAESSKELKGNSKRRWKEVPWHLFNLNI